MKLNFMSIKINDNNKIIKTKRRSLRQAVINLRVHKMRGITGLAENRLASQEGLCSKD